MRLMLRSHHVRDVAWARTTRLADGVLAVDRDALARELLRDERLADVAFEIARPGESCRIAGVFDVVEPRAKLEPSGADFPGVLSPVQSVGEGTTRVLRGLAVTTLDGGIAGRNAIIDLGSPFGGHPAEYASRYAGLHHVVVVPRLASGVGGADARQALRVASLRAAVHLARTVSVGAPDAEQVLELGATPAELPRIAYVLQIHSHQLPTVAGEPVLYGDNVRHLVPTVLHPNEILDGALVRPYLAMLLETYGIQNNAVVSELHDRHGRELTFAGVVVYVANQLVEERQRAVVMAGNLVRWTLRADAAVFTKSGGGAPNVDMAMIAERCEQLGVKTGMMMWGGAVVEDSALFNAPTLDAIVSIGSNAFEFELPPVERVITSRPQEAGAVRGTITLPPTRLVGVIDHFGSSRLAGVVY